jgi:hypothetical protein
MKLMKWLADTAPTVLLSSIPLQGDTSPIDRLTSPAVRWCLDSPYTSPVPRPHRALVSSFFISQEESHSDYGMTTSLVCIANSASAFGAPEAASQFSVSLVESVRREETYESTRAKDLFERDYPRQPDKAVAGLLGQITRAEGSTAGISPVQAASILLSHLPRASYGRQNLLLDALRASLKT